MHDGFVILRKADTSRKYGCEPDKRSIPELLQMGIVVVNKPSGPTSHQVADYVKRIFGLSKAGHSGTLDPHVTGVLPVALGRATRIVQVLLPSGKEYVCLMHLHKAVEKERLAEALKKFTGKIKQLPPVKSAVKREERERVIYYLELMEMDSQDVLFRVGCQAGTYIRKLCHDIGQDLGVGAHMAQLVRTKAGVFQDTEMYTLQHVKDAFWYFTSEKNENYIRQVVKPVEAAVAKLEKVFVLDSAVDSICHGAELKIPGISMIGKAVRKGNEVAIMSLKGELIAIGRASMGSEEVQNTERGVAVRTSKVFMLPGTYPRINA